MNVSIIIPIKNARRYIKTLLERIHSQDFEGNVEVIVIDSGSVDGSLEMIENSRTRIVKINPDEFSHGATRKLGIEISNGEVVVFLTQDALPTNNLWLQYLTYPFIINDRIVGVFGRHIPYGNCNIVEAESITNHFYRMGNNISLRGMDSTYNSCVQQRMRVCFFSDNNSAIRKNITACINYSNIAFAEDQEWAKRAIENGYLIAYTPFATVFHSHNLTIYENFRRRMIETKYLRVIYGSEANSLFIKQVRRSAIDAFRLILFPFGLSKIKKENRLLMIKRIISGALGTIAGLFS